MVIFVKRFWFISVLFILGMMGSVAQTGASATQAAGYAETLSQIKSKKSNKGGSKFSAEEKAIMKRSADALARSMPDPGLKVGEKAPDFTLPNAFGKKVSLYSELKKGPVVLVFYRGAWCPYCNLHLRTLKLAQPEFRKYSAQLIAVTPQKPERSAGQIKKSAYTFEVLSDLDSKVMKDYRLYFELEPDLNKLYIKHGLDVAAFNGPGRTVLPIPGSFVIDRKGIVRAMHADTDYQKRMEPADMVNALKALNGLPL